MLTNLWTIHSSVHLLFKCKIDPMHFTHTHTHTHTYIYIIIIFFVFLFLAFIFSTGETPITFFEKSFFVMLQFDNFTQFDTEFELLSLPLSLPPSHFLYVRAYVCVCVCVCVCVRQNENKPESHDLRCLALFGIRPKEWETQWELFVCFHGMPTLA